MTYSQKRLSRADRRTQWKVRKAGTEKKRLAKQSGKSKLRRAAKKANRLESERQLEDARVTVEVPPHTLRLFQDLTAIFSKHPNPLSLTAVKDIIHEGKGKITLRVNYEAVREGQSIRWDHVTSNDIIYSRLCLGTQLSDFWTVDLMREIFPRMKGDCYLIFAEQDPNISRFLLLMGLDPFLTLDRAHPNFRFHFIRILLKKSQGCRLIRLEKLFLRAALEHNYGSSTILEDTQWTYYLEARKYGFKNAFGYLSKSQLKTFRAFELTMAWHWQNGGYLDHVTDLKAVKEGMDFILPNLNRDLGNKVLKDDGVFTPIRITRNEVSPFRGKKTEVPKLDPEIFEDVMGEFCIFKKGAGNLEVTKDGFLQLVESAHDEMGGKTGKVVVKECDKEVLQEFEDMCVDMAKTFSFVEEATNAHDEVVLDGTSDEDDEDDEEDAEEHAAEEEEEDVEMVVGEKTWEDEEECGDLEDGEGAWDDNPVFEPVSFVLPLRPAPPVAVPQHTANAEGAKFTPHTMQMPLRLKAPDA